MALLGGCAALVLAGCTGDDSPGIGAKGMATLSPQTVALLRDKDMTKDSPLVVRIFKEESELEVWKETRNGDYALLKTYPICRWSGELGPKVKEGDRQAPEGFYTVTPGQMNPNSQYHLSFDLGFPNAFDRAHGRSGSNLMVHGDCSSRGCYAMTDEQVQEVFALGRESFRGGQRSFQVQAYPFRMTTENMVRHRNNPNLAFWKMLKEGSDTFEITKAPPRVDFCGKRYVFNASPTDPSQRFQASAACPDYQQTPGLAGALASRQQQVATRIASAGALSPVAPVKTGKDGGMHEVFLAKLANPELKAPGSLPAIVKPPGSDYGVETNQPAPAESIALASADMVPTAANVPLPAPKPTDIPGARAAATQVASAPAGSAQMASAGETSLFGRLLPSAPASAQVASLDGGGFMDSVRSLFGRDEAPASGAPAPAPAEGSGFSLGRLFGGGASAPAPAETASTMMDADVPVPPAPPSAAPPARTSALSQPAQPRAAAPAQPRSVVARPAPAPARPAAESASTRPAATSPTVPAAAPAAPVVPHPAQAAAAAYYSTLPAAATPVGASAANDEPVPALRPSVAASGSEPIYGAPGAGSALPGAAILTPGSFSTSVQ